MAPRLTILALLAASAAFAQQAPQPEGDVVFRSDTALVRVDVQVLEGNRPVTGLQPESFILRENGQVRRILNFVAEEMPIDLLFLLDVSGSMRPHVERMLDAARESLPSMAEHDRIGVMVFDRSTRVRMKFTNNSPQSRREFLNVIRGESFNGGTDITRGLLQAANYMRKEGRKEARHAIVMLTDDQTEFEADEARVLRALSGADAVMSVLLVPNIMTYGGQMPRRRSGGTWGGGWPGGGGGWPGGGGGWPGGGGGRFPGGGGGRFPGGGYPGGGGGPVSAGTQSAGSAEIARESGGDVMQAAEASALQDTLDRLRQRYALHFNLPAGARAGERRAISIALHERVRQQHPAAELKYRRSYIAADNSTEEIPDEPTVSSNKQTEPEPVEEEERPAIRRRRPAAAPTTTRESIPEEEPAKPRRRVTTDGSQAPKGPIVQ